MVRRNIIKGLSIALSVLIYLFGWLSPSYAGESPWPLFLAAINAGKNNITPLPPTVTSAGQIWMDRNLGASRVATSARDTAAYGDYYQWGRGTDGHEKRNSSTTTELSSTDVPGHGNFITVPGYPYPHSDWRTPRNDNLWQGVSGKNNPCPAGFRLPTITELNTERASWSYNKSAGASAFASPLKLVVTGARSYGKDSRVHNAGIHGYYWSSTVSTVLGDYSRILAFDFYTDDAAMSNTPRANGLTVRCIKD